MDDQHIVKLNDRPYLLFVGVVAEAHAQGLQGVMVDLIQVPNESNGMTAIVKATVRMRGDDGGPEKIFEDYGDANPRNCSARVATAVIRMASTRAMGRAMRVAANIAHTLVEELGDTEPAGGSYDEPRQVQTPHRAASSGGGASGMASYHCSVCKRSITKGQYDVTAAKFDEPLCLNHAREAEAAEAA